MTNERYRNKLHLIFNHAPALKQILLSEESIEVKRQNVRKYLSEMLIATFEDNPTIPPLEWVITRDAIGVFRNILSARSERLAGFSFLSYIDNLLNGKNMSASATPRSGFFAELERLIRGILRTVLHDIR